ncbi:MAG: glycosyltransferase, partial [Chloroflexi bacterium]|nr:glycosyltransferase [Chloroflexota bacterium]
MDPILTIIMCAYNEMGRIQPALDEVLVSLDGRSEGVEVIVLDNCSTDGTREWLGKLEHSRIRVELNERNLGKGGSIKKGIGLSHG